MVTVGEGNRGAGDPAMPPMGPLLPSIVRWVLIVRSGHGVGRIAQSSSGNIGVPCNCRKVLIIVCVPDRGGLYASTRVVSEWFGSCPHIVAVRGACRRVGEVGLNGAFGVPIIVWVVVPSC